MKKFFLLAAVVGVALTSCVKNEGLATVADQNEITFEVAKFKASSRAEVEEVAFPTDIPFGAYAYYENTENPGTHSLYIDNAEIVYKVSNGNGYWAAKEHTYFWPTQGHLDFICYAPYNVEKTSPAVPKISDTDVQQTLKYEGFKVDAANPVDLLYSDKAMQQTANTAHYGFTGVPTLFHHALAKLNFKVKAFRINNADESPKAVTSWTVVVKKITINGIYDEGNLTMKTANVHNQGATTVQWENTITAVPFDVWSNTSSQTSKVWECNQTLTTEARHYGAGTADVAENYFVLPQAMSAGIQNITIEYSITTQAPEGQTGVKEYSATKNFSDFPAVPAWEQGKNITYTIDIDPVGDEIHFAPAIVDWENVDGTISI
ncbi:MAG: fimbrillin family protein [Alistipes sp.]|nr:fimbrillin family protein [Alistipes sp.]